MYRFSAATLAALSCAISFGVCRTATACETDNDCKGDRICENDVCVDPTPPGAAPAPVVEAPAAPPPQLPAPLPAPLPTPLPEPQSADQPPPTPAYQPAPAPSPAPSPQPPPAPTPKPRNGDDELNTGIFYIGWLYSPSFGTFAFSRTGDMFQRPTEIIPLAGSLNLGFHIVKKRVGFELGVVYTGPEIWKTNELRGSKGDTDWVLHAHRAISSWTLMPRLLIPIKRPHAFFTAELEIGVSLFQGDALVSGEDFVSEKDLATPQLRGAARVGFSFFLNDWVELRVNPAGFGLVYFPVKNSMAGSILAYSPSAGFVLRI
jgi:hypothetical protein